MKLNSEDFLLPMSIALVLGIIATIISLVITYEEPTQVSELSFLDASKLPHNVQSGQTYDVSQKLHNQKLQDQEYIITSNIQTFKLYDLTEGTYDCLSPYRKKVSLLWLVDNSSQHNISPSYTSFEGSDIVFPSKNLEIAFLLTSFFGKGNLYINLNGTSIVLSEKYQSISLQGERSATESYLFEPGKTKKILLRIQDERLQVISFEDDEEIVLIEAPFDFEQTSLQFATSDAFFSVKELVIHSQSTDKSLVQEFELDQSQVESYVSTLTKKTSHTLHMIHRRIPQSPTIFNKSYEVFNLSSEETPHPHFLIETDSNSSNHSFPWNSFRATIRTQLVGRGEIAFILGNYSQGIIISHPTNSVILFTKEKDIISMKRSELPLGDGTHQLVLNVSGNNTIWRLDSLSFPSHKAYEGEHLWMSTRNTIPYILGYRVNSQEDNCLDRSFVGGLCSKNYVIDNQPRLPQSRTITQASTDERTSIFSSIQNVVDSLTQGSVENATSVVLTPIQRLFNDLNISGSNPIIPDRQVNFDGPVGQIHNISQHTFHVNFNVLDGAGLVWTSFTNENGGEYKVIFNEELDQAYLLLDDTIFTTNVSLEKNVWYQLWFEIDNEEVIITLDQNIELFRSGHANMSYGYYAIGTYNTYANFKWAGIRGPNLIKRDLAIQDDPCQLKLVGEEQILQESIYLDANEEYIWTSSFTPSGSFDYGKVTTHVQDTSQENSSLSIHFWVSKT